jgi:hypothetical protein
VTEAARPGPDTPLDFFALARVLVEHEVEFVIIGGIAVSLHGYVRATKDVDIVPAPGTANLTRLWGALNSLAARPASIEGFAPNEVPMPFSLESMIEGGGNWILYTRLGRIDLMPYVEDEDGEVSYDELCADAEVLEVEEVGGNLLFASLPRLISMKLRAGRDVDVLDVSALRKAHGLDDD